jgi:putative endonuclease
MSGWVYITASRKHGTLYVGVTNDLARRIHEHRERSPGSFTARYGVTRLVWYEPYATMPDAIVREKAIKRWPRAWKVQLVEGMNPEWSDLYDSLNM